MVQQRNKTALFPGSRRDSPGQGPSNGGASPLFLSDSALAKRIQSRKMPGAWPDGASEPPSSGCLGARRRPALQTAPCGRPDAEVPQTPRLREEPAVPPAPFLASAISLLSSDRFHVRSGTAVSPGRGQSPPRILTRPDGGVPLSTGLGAQSHAGRNSPARIVLGHHPDPLPPSLLLFPPADVAGRCAGSIAAQGPSLLL